MKGFLLGGVGQILNTLCWELQERERIRAEKRAAKERRREEARAKEMYAKKRAANNGGGDNSDTRHEMERPHGSPGGSGQVANGTASQAEGKTCLVHRLRRGI